MNILQIIGYILIAFALYRLVITRCSCPMTWGALVVGIIIVWNRGKLN